MVLATIPLSERVPGADRLFDPVFVLVVIFTLLQAGTLDPAERRLRAVSRRGRLARWFGEYGDERGE